MAHCCTVCKEAEVLPAPIKWRTNGIFLILKSSAMQELYRQFGDSSMVSFEKRVNIYSCIHRSVERNVASSIQK